MVSSLISVSLALVLGPAAALVDARRDCERLRGDAGLAACTQAIRENPQDGSAYNLRGLRYYARGDLDSALADYTKRVELEPKNPEAYDRRGLLYQAKALREIGADQPTLAATMAAAKHLERALADHDRAIELDPKYAPAYINRADVYRKSGDRDRALADYGKAIELAPNYAFAYGHRGFFLQEVGDVDRALADYNTAIRLNPHYAAAYGARADILFRKGDLDRALADHSKVIAIEPNDAAAYRKRGVIHRLKGDLGRMLADFDKAVVFDPKYSDGYYYRGFVHLAQGDLARAIADYDRAIELRPIYFNAFFERGVANLYSGSAPKALADLRQAHELHAVQPYTALWLDIVSKRANLASPLAQAIENVDMTQWPAPVVRMFLGELTAEAVLAAANHPQAQVRSEQVCEANFYIGALALQQRRKDEAIRRFRAAAGGCNKGLIEAAAANAELRALGVAR
jgi:tetratricopeptide (TPR) repeat protein